MKFSPKRFLSSKIFLVVTVAIFIFLSISFAKEFSRRYYLEQQIESLESQVAELESQNQEVAKLIEYFETQNFTEEEARLKMGLKKPGEEVIIINQPELKIFKDQKTDILSGLSNPAKWWYYFVKRNSG